MVRFPVSNLEPLRYTVQNGNDTEARPSSSQSVDKGDTTISPPDTRPQVSEDTEIGTDTTLLANGGENPVISDERISAVNSGTGGGEGGDTEQDQLDKTLHRRKGTIYNLVAITVSVMYVYIMVHLVCIHVKLGGVSDKLCVFPADKSEVQNSAVQK